MMKEIWVSPAKAAKLLKVSERTVQRKIMSFEYRKISGHGRGGKKYEILLSSLPEEAQARYAGLEPVFPGQEILETCYGKQREAADFRLFVVRSYHESGLSPEAFVNRHNTENPPEDAITISKLFRWQKKLKEGGPAALFDRRGGHNRGCSSIPEEAWDYFYSLYMTQQKRGVQICYDYTAKRYPDIPGIGAFRRKVAQIPELALIRYRDGEEAFRNALPSMDRDKTDIHSNAIWFSDHHRLDVFTRSEEGPGKICRLWLTVFFDARSNRVVSHICREAAPDAAVIKQCLKMGIETCGVPDELYFDNGKDYRSKAFRSDFPASVCEQLGIGRIYATPYHGQAKTVERFFRTLEERFGKMFPTYAGKDAKCRPERMRTSNERIYALAVDTETFRKLLDNYIDDYNHTPSRGSGMEGKSPEEIYYRNLTVKKEVADRQALSILCGTFETRTVGKNGISLKHRIYENNRLRSLYGKKVYVSYLPENMDTVYIFDEDMKAVCTAEARVRTPFRHTTEEDFRKAQKQKRKARQETEKYRPHVEQDIISIIAQNQLSEKLRNEEAYRPAATEPVNSPISMAAFEPEQVSVDGEASRPDFRSVLSEKYAQQLKRRTGG